MSAEVSLPLGLSGAELDGRYRYRLWRIWDEGAERLAWVMLNPSVADGTSDDPTIRKCIGFARRWGFGSIEVVNLYAFRATAPRVLHAAIKEFGEPYAVGPRNEDSLIEVCTHAKTVIAAWGAKDFAGKRAASVKRTLLERLPSVLSLGRTEGGEPRHPLYVPYDTAPEPFT